MAADAKISLFGKIENLGETDRLMGMFEVAGVTAKDNNYQTQAVADTDEALNIGGVTTPSLVIINAVTNDVNVDTSFDTTFHAEISIPEGEWAMFKPAGTVHIKNATAAEEVTVESWCWGV